MANSIRNAVVNCLPGLRRYWRPLCFILIPVSFLGGFLLVEPGVKPLSLILGSVAMGFISAFAATAEKFKAFAAGGPFFTLGLCSGALSSQMGFSADTLASLLLVVFAVAAGLFFGLFAQEDKKK